MVYLETANFYPFGIRQKKPTQNMNALYPITFLVTGENLDNFLNASN